MADTTEEAQAAAERKARKEAKRKEKADKLQASADKKAALAAASIADAAKPSASSSSKANRPHDTPEVQLSKALAYLLRHGALKEKLPIRADGYVALDALLARPRLQSIRMRPEEGSSSKPTAEDVRVAVRDNAKKRFELAQVEGTEYVRALQGHSLEEVKDLDLVHLSLADLDAPTYAPKAHTDLASSLEQLDVSAGQASAGMEVLHGTTRDAWQLILASGGLSRMKRNHIHLASGRPGSSGVISGMRASSPIMLHIDVRQALAARIPFFRASNGAILTPGEAETGILPLRFISHVEDRKEGVIWRRQGEQAK